MRINGVQSVGFAEFLVSGSSIEKCIEKFLKYMLLIGDFEDGFNECEVEEFDRCFKIGYRNGAEDYNEDWGED